MNSKDRLIVALDVNSESKALGLVDILKSDVNIFKIGLELFVSAGPGIVEKIRRKGGKIFLDLKFHDIPNTVAKAVSSAVRLKPFMFNIHAMGGIEMMKRAADEAGKEAKKTGVARPKLLAVTVLTSADEKTLKEIGINDNMTSLVARLAGQAKAAGLDGVVASALEAEIIRKDIGKDFLIVTPGVRPERAASGDQKRITTPAEAISKGADFIVVGRPILEADDPARTARKIQKEISGRYDRKRSPKSF
jgi:orotidine-5'-phosphate decarboxylase